MDAGARGSLALPIEFTGAGWNVLDILLLFLSEVYSIKGIYCFTDSIQKTFLTACIQTFMKLNQFAPNLAWW